MLELTWMGQMGLIVKSETTTICIDYFASKDPGRLTPVPVAAEELKGIDAFLGTHDHLDHIDHKSWKVWARTNAYDFDAYIEAKYGERIRCKVPEVGEKIILK